MKVKHKHGWTGVVIARCKPGYLCVRPDGIPEGRKLFHFVCREDELEKIL
jgi:hypothetical protein